MPIKIDYSPVGTLMNLARSAGEAQEAQVSAAHDLAFTQMAMQAQTQNAQIASTIRRNDQTFQLQQAAQARQARTPTRAAPGVSPVAQEVDQVLQRQAVARDWEQRDTAAQMEQLSTIPGLSDQQRESAKLQIMAGQPLAQILKGREPEWVGLTGTQTESVRRQLYQQRRSDLEAERERILDAKLYPGWKHTEVWQKHLDAIVSRIQSLDIGYTTGGRGGGGVVDPLGKGESTRVTEDLAKQLLQETGGDITKARELARQRGLQF